MELESWLLFSSIALVATITPGPAVLLVAANTIEHGVRPTIYTILGNISGLFLLSLLSVMGLGALLMYSAVAFTTIKIAGAIYLIYLGVRLWKSGFSDVSAKEVFRHDKKPARHLHMYAQGIMVALSNPKAIAFTTALFPQFINRELPLFPQFTLLVLTFMSYSFICLLIYSCCSARTKIRIGNSRLEKIVSRFFASLFIGSGIILGTSS
jgi:threonine/homoserine/homoserine lactone efflux protein